MAVFVHRSILAERSVMYIIWEQCRQPARQGRRRQEVSQAYSGGERIKSAYNAGIVKATAKGGVAGLGLEASSSSRTVQNVFYSDEYEAVGNLNGCTIQNGTATAKTSDGLKALTSEDLGGGFAADTNGINSGYPVLAWQNGTVKSDDPEKDDNGWQGEAAKDVPQQKDGVYQIGKPAELAWFAEKAAQDSTDLKAVLTADLDLNNNVWTGIGGQTADTGFAGTLDGAGTHH